MRCMSCFHKTLRSSPRYLIDLTYEAAAPSPRIRNYPPHFCKILEDSFKREVNQRMFCDRCRGYKPVSSRETVQSIPQILVLNTGLSKQSEGRSLWSISGWLPDKIGISMEDGTVRCFEGEALRSIQRNRHLRQPTVYNLVGLVADVNSGEHQKPHMVSLINVALSARQPLAESRWHLFNDFLVRPVDKDEALHFAATWKSPTVIMYQHEAASNNIDDAWKQSLDTTCLYNHWSINFYQVQRENWPLLLDLDHEIPGPGTHVPIDTEFVKLQQEEIEILASGDRKVIRPTREGLARVSVLRASGPDEGLPFINDYINISEPVVDYVTKYSGVTAEDLDPRRSSHPLVPLKVAYKKLWLLLNLGCVFVGHGLIKDFRNVNIFVPKSQVVDTVTLFYNPSRSKRNLSLRYLAWYLLKENIQSETHDSIEDAWTALRLWKKYEEYKDAGVVEQIIDEIYTAGRKHNFRVPEKGREKFLGIGTSGRDTPEMASGVSGPTTPVGKKTGGSEYFESPNRENGKGIRREEAVSCSPSPDHNGSDNGLEAQWHQQLRQVYGDLTENSENRQDVESEAISGPVQEEATVDEFDFRLFLGEVGEDAKRVALGSPPPLNSEPGFVRPRRGDDYYFTGTRTAEAMEGFRSVVAGWEEVVKGARVSWKGWELPWRVTTIKLPSSKKNKLLKGDVVPCGEDVDGLGKKRRRRKGKKGRIAIRMRLQRAREKATEDEKRQAERNEAEREKRNRRNREKKVKKREKKREEKKKTEGNPFKEQKSAVELPG
ncbi:MAG: hypothetical protein Q9190_004080 [Brigantiaea leucoxantha]